MLQLLPLLPLTVRHFLLGDQCRSGDGFGIDQDQRYSTPSMKIGDASKLRSGDWVLAIGNPLGEGIIATQGIISRLGVSVPYSATQTYNDLIETTAPINPGNSGGPLINMAGEVIGITTLGASGVQGMGYAISMVDALPVIQKLSGK